MNVLHHEHAGTRALHNRRMFLRRTAAGSLFLLFGRIAVPSARAASDADAPLSFFDRHEFEVFMHVADRIIGPRPPEAPGLDEIVRRADAFLSLAHPEIQEQFHLLLTLFDSAVVATLFDLRFSSFLGMSPASQDDYLADWMTSPLAFRRTAFMGLKRLAVSVYYTHPGSWEKIGFDGDYGSASLRISD